MCCGGQGRGRAHHGEEVTESRKFRSLVGYFKSLSYHVHTWGVGPYAIKTYICTAALLITWCKEGNIYFLLRWNRISFFFPCVAKPILTCFFAAERLEETGSADAKERGEVAGTDGGTTGSTRQGCIIYYVHMYTPPPPHPPPPPYIWHYRGTSLNEPTIFRTLPIIFILGTFFKESSHTATKFLYIWAKIACPLYCVIQVGCQLCIGKVSIDGSHACVYFMT